MIEVLPLHQRLDGNGFLEPIDEDEDEDFFDDEEDEEDDEDGDD